ncbi:MAG: flagellar motor switch protein FliN [Firmicutes bacterium]|nr:flagellar motor switch protein FliN [Bacillota bacterium]
MVRSALVQPGGGEHPITQKQVMPEQDVAVFNELGKAVTMAAEPWLREVLQREVLADTSGLRFLPLPSDTEQRQPFMSWLVRLTGDKDEMLLVRMAKAHAEYFAPNGNEEANAALTTLVGDWTELWFATVAQLVGWQISIQTTRSLDSMPRHETLLPWGQGDLAATLTCGWTFADGGVVLLECWMPVNFVRQIAQGLISGGIRRGPEQGNLRASVVRTYRKESPSPLGHTPVLPVRFPVLEQTTATPTGSGMDLVRDVYLDVAAVLAKTEMRIGQLLELKIGDVVELGKMAGEPMELSLNGHNIARGEVLVLDDQLGIRISEVISVADRLEKTQGGQE